MDAENLKHYIWLLVAKFKREIKEAQDNKNHSLGPEDDAYKMGYLMAYYDIIVSMRVWASEFDINAEEIGLGYSLSETYVNFLLNLSFASQNLYQKRINLKKEKNYDGEFDQLNDNLIDQCELLHILAKFDKDRESLLLKFYNHLEPLYQDYVGIYPSDRKRTWKKNNKNCKGTIGSP